MWRPAILCLNRQTKAAGSEDPAAWKQECIRLLDVGYAFGTVSQSFKKRSMPFLVNGCSII